MQSCQALLSSLIVKNLPASRCLVGRDNYGPLNTDDQVHARQHVFGTRPHQLYLLRAYSGASSSDVMLSSLGIDNISVLRSLREACGDGRQAPR